MWHTQSLSDIEARLNTDFRSGLSSAEASVRLHAYGENRLPEGKRESIATLFFRQFKSPLIYVLFLACLIVFYLGEYIDAAIILFVLVFNAIVGSIQEGRAQNTLRALKRFAESHATVLRDGKEIIIPDTRVVPGDIVILQEGEKIPADARIIESSGMRIDESALTGESIPVTKVPTVLPNAFLPISEQKNMAFKGVNVVGGSGRAIIVSTGINTIIGKMSQTIASIDTEIPLAKDIRKLSHGVIIAVVGISLGLLAGGMAQGNSLRHMFEVVVTLAVSVIPEGLPIVMTLVLATGVWRMAKRNALVKRLQAVESLGQANVIAVDKTGTITKNELIVRRVYVGGSLFEIGGSGYEPKGDVRRVDEHGTAHPIDPLNHPELLFAAKVAALSSNARIAFIKSDGVWRVTGDPTEAALLTFGEKIGFRREELLEEMPRISEIPFDYRTKYHAVAHQAGDGQLVMVVGAPEAILTLSRRIFVPTADAIRFSVSSEELTHERSAQLEKEFHQLSKDGLRVVAFGFLRLPAHGKNTIIEMGDHITFAGFFAMEDSLRTEAIGAVEEARGAGMHIIMITGDHVETATALARKVGIYRQGDAVLTGHELTTLPERELRDKLARVTVFARVTPEDKMKIVQAYRSRGDIIAMTGDGVNDAPSLVAADLGISMGKIGTEVAREASDIVLLDDNFKSIVSAIEEGRSIYKTIKKVILYLFSTSVGEVLAIAGALFVGMPLPVLPAQILWLNLVTDGFLDVALAMEPKEEGLLKKAFRRSQRSLVDGLMIQRIVVMGIPMMVGTLWMFSRAYESGGMGEALTVSMVTLAVFQWFNAWNCRSEDRSLFTMNPFSNRFLLAALGVVITLQLLAVYTPFLQSILRTVPISAREWGMAVLVASSVIVIEEVRKFFYRAWKRNKHLSIA